ncbi:basic proline-rich protein-like [Hippopotamus amphibius kiboko]|uniref:basic proline-rich protein-like n=1 Tax=Hippopotamus amphibius kiboko TaxID=575201 RepID=UPI002592B243|nr:basic proline-rich protein-like [Hippopotamus amphibius kiboko]
MVGSGTSAPPGPGLGGPRAAGVADWEVRPVPLALPRPVPGPWAPAEAAATEAAACGQGARRPPRPPRPPRRGAAPPAGAGARGAAMRGAGLPPGCGRWRLPGPTPPPPPPPPGGPGSGDPRPGRVSAGPRRVGSPADGARKRPRVKRSVSGPGAAAADRGPAAGPGAGDLAHGKAAETRGTWARSVRAAPARGPPTPTPGRPAAPSPGDSAPSGLRETPCSGPAEVAPDRGCLQPWPLAPFRRGRVAPRRPGPDAPPVRGLGGAGAVGEGPSQRRPCSRTRGSRAVLGPPGGSRAVTRCTEGPAPGSQAHPPASRDGGCVTVDVAVAPNPGPPRAYPGVTGLGPHEPHSSRPFLTQAQLQPTCCPCPVPSHLNPRLPPFLLPTLPQLDLGEPGRSPAAPAAPQRLWLPRSLGLAGPGPGTCTDAPSRDSPWSTSGCAKPGPACRHLAGTSRCQVAQQRQCGGRSPSPGGTDPPDPSANRPKYRCPSARGSCCWEGVAPHGLTSLRLSGALTTLRLDSPGGTAPEADGASAGTLLLGAPHPVPQLRDK